ncbi:ABC transporter permease [Starkeya sp. ORNL1]|uniref:ABC transporter permease n=1 Tax=Starkeya sp. ORNL1 TaxID=2709380 RepID=UPI001464824B|nr:ABC transporter permease [Starkeya sp. ORNL1]QJP16320.1 ABC transporter permease [Starkeya sp. ORNL1]
MSVTTEDLRRAAAGASLTSGIAAASRLLGGALWKTASLLAVFALLELLPRLSIVDQVWFPPLSKVLAVLWQMLRSGELQNHIVGSLTRSVTGFGLAALVAVPLGLTIGWYARVRSFLNPVLEFFRNTSALALLPVFILFLGIGEASKIGIVTFACFFPILLSTISGVKSVDPLLIKSARSLALSAPAIFAKIILPSAVPSVFTGFRLAAQSSILVLIAAEMVGATRGLGYLINYAQFNFLLPKMYAGILTIAFIGLAINQLLVTIERRLSRWRVPASGE